MKEKRYYCAEEVLKFLGLDYEFTKKAPEYPFNRGCENVQFQWPSIIIPKGNIEKALLNKVRNVSNDFKSEIKMLIQIPFIVKSEDTGVININLSLEWRYDKQYMRGDISTTFEEVCLYVFDVAVRSNDYYIINSELGIDFMSYYVIPNQWGIGRLVVSSACMVKLNPKPSVSNNEINDANVQKEV